MRADHQHAFETSFRLVSMNSGYLYRHTDVTRLDNPSGQKAEKVDDLLTIETRWSREEIRCDEEAKCHQQLLPCRLKVG